MQIAKIVRGKVGGVNASLAGTLNVSLVGGTRVPQFVFLGQMGSVPDEVPKISSLSLWQVLEEPLQ